MKVKTVSFCFVAKEMCEKKVVVEIADHIICLFSDSSNEWAASCKTEIEQLRKRLSKPLGSSIQSVVSVDRDYCSDSMEFFIWD